MQSNLVSRKKKKHTRKQRAKANAKITRLADPKTLLQQVESLRESGQFARAREGARRLYRSDAAEHKELFVSLTFESVRVEVENGRYEQACTFIAEGPPTDWQGQESTKRDWASAMVFSKDAKKRVEAAGFCITLDNPDPSVLRHAADVLVLMKKAPAQAVTDGIQLLAQKEWDALDQTVKQITRKSPFAHWRLFLTGMSAWYQGDEESARKFLSKLDPGTVPGKKARAVLAVLGDDQTDEAFQELGRLLKQPKLFPQIAKADRALSDNRFHSVQSSLAQISGFPSFNRSIPGILTHCFLKDIPHPGVQEVGDQLIDRTLQQITSGKQNVSFSQAFLWSSILLKNAGILSSESAPEEMRMLEQIAFGKFESSFNKLFFPAHELGAFWQLQKAFNFREYSDPFSYDEDDDEASIFCLKKAIELCPDFERPYHLLLNYYEFERMSKEANRLMDEMTKRFPESPSIIAKAAKNCFQRKTYTKALRYFKKLEIADPLCNRTKLAIFQCHLAIAFEKAAKGNGKATEKAIAEAEAARVDAAAVSTVEFALLQADWFAVVGNETVGIATGKIGTLPGDPVSKYLDHWLRMFAWENVAFRSKNFDKRPKMPPKKVAKGDLSPGDCINLLELVDLIGLSIISTKFFDTTVHTTVGVVKKAQKQDVADMQRLVTWAFWRNDDCSDYEDLRKQLSLRIKKYDPDNLYAKIFELTGIGYVEQLLEFEKEVEQRSAEIQSDPQLSRMIAELKKTFSRFSRIIEQFDRPFNEAAEIFGDDDEMIDDEDEDEDFMDVPINPPRSPRKKAASKPQPEREPAGPALQQIEFDFS